jgi:hypothetical protein
MDRRQQALWHLQVFEGASQDVINELCTPENRDIYVPTPVHAMGVSSAEQVLSALDTNFDQLRSRMEKRGKPVLDVGANLSTLSAEGILNGVHIMATDLHFEKNAKRILPQIESRLRSKRNIFTNGEYSISIDEDVNSDNRMEITPDNWDTTVAVIMDLVQQNFSECAAHEITLPRDNNTSEKSRASDRHFSTVIAHHSVPQYCVKEDFTTCVLPELLRVTDDTLLIYPLQYGDKALTFNSPEVSTIVDIARQSGFQVDLEIAPIEHFPTSLRARFTRKKLKP